MTSARREGALLLALGCVPFALGAALPRDGSGLLPPCPFRAVTGLPCPLCGGTRAFAWAARGDAGFLRYNGFWVLVALVLAAAGVFVLVTRTRVLSRVPPLWLLAGLAAGGWAWALAERATIAPG